MLGGVLSSAGSHCKQLVGGHGERDKSFKEDDFRTWLSASGLDNSLLKKNGWQEHANAIILLDDFFSIYFLMQVWSYFLDCYSIATAMLTKRHILEAA